MIIINTKGGLGNQMYQYALYLTLKENGKDAKLCTEHFEWAEKEKRNLIAEHGKYYLIEDVFKTKGDKASSKEIRRLSTSRMDLASRFRRKLGLQKKTHLYEKKMNHPSLDELLQLDNVFLDGYWQRFDYYLNSEKEIRNAFVFAHDLDYRNKELADTLKRQNSVSIHVRRTDYLKTSTYVIQDETYYISAIKFVLDHITNPVFYCFSDDMEWCRNIFGRIGVAVNYVDWNNGKASYIDMQLMSLCKSNIITNSSFSMWAAWLNKNRNKIIIRPHNYYTDQNEDHFFYWPEGWITVN